MKKEVLFIEAVKKKVLFIEAVNYRYDEKELEKPLGGSETIFLFLIRELRKRNDLNLSVIFRNEIECFRSQTVYDLVLAYRDPMVLGMFNHTRSKKNVAFFQDMPSEGTIIGLRQLGQAGLIHKMIFLSHFQKEAYLSQLPMFDEGRHVLMFENGLEGTLFNKKLEKEDAFIYASTPYRGLDILLEIWPEIHKRLPGTRLKVAGSVDMYDVSTNPEAINQGGRELNRAGEALYEKEIPGVEWLGGIPHDKLIEEMLKSKGLLYPCTFPETSCHVLNCALHAGCSPIVSTAGGAISEKVCHGENGVIIPGDPHGKDFKELYVESLVETYNSGRLDRMNKLNKGSYKGWEISRLADRLVSNLLEWERIEGVNQKILGITCSLKGNRKDNWKNLLWYSPYDLMTDELVGLPIDQARNAACAMAVYKEADWILFLDDDIYVRSNFIVEMMSRAEDYNTGVVAGNYFYKDDQYLVPVTRVVRNFDNRALSWKEMERMTEEELNSDGFRTVCGGSGALLISTEVLETMGRPWFRTQSTMAGRHTGEDTYFYQELHRLKIPFWVAWDVPVLHYDSKKHKYYGRKSDMESVKADMRSYKERIAYIK